MCDCECIEWTGSEIWLIASLAYAIFHELVTDRRNFFSVIIHCNSLLIFFTHTISSHYIGMLRVE